MISVFIRTIIIYFIVLIVIRLMGKSEISQFQPFEVVIAIMIADLAIVPMQNPGISLVNGIISIIALLITHIIISAISIKNKKVHGLTSGHPSILINKGKIDIEELAKQSITISELLQRARQEGSPYIEQVYYAILEPSGDLSIIEKKNKPHIEENGERGLQVGLIINKEIDEDNLRKSGKDINWLNKQLNKLKLKIENILLLCIDEQDNIVYFMEE